MQDLQIAEMEWTEGLNDSSIQDVYIGTKKLRDEERNARAKVLVERNYQT